MKEIKLTQNKITLVDDDVYELIKNKSWCAFTHKRRKTYYAVGTIKDENGKHKTIRLHRFILKVTDKNVFVDHIDGNGLNNQRGNLRISTREQNQQNRPKNKNNKSGYKGVYFDKAKNKWTSKIMVNRKAIHLGRFDDVKIAAKAYQDAALKYHGEFSKY